MEKQKKSLQASDVRKQADGVGVGRRSCTRRVQICRGLVILSALRAAKGAPGQVGRGAKSIHVTSGRSEALLLWINYRERGFHFSDDDFRQFRKKASTTSTGNRRR